MLEAFPALSPRLDGDDTVLSGSIRDHAELYGVIHQLESLGLELLEVRRTVR
jgi:hypothetical protein